MRFPLSKKKEISQTPAIEPRPVKGDTVFALLRRLGARLSAVEQNMSTIRRDLNRLDRKVYREPEEAAKIDNLGSGAAPKLVGLPDIFRSL